MESGLRDRTTAGSSLRHWPPGTNRNRSCRFFLLGTCRLTCPPQLTFPLTRPWFVPQQWVI